MQRAVLSLVLAFTTPVGALLAQVPGVYALRGVREVASVLQLKPDSTFEFFHSYGAVDRFGQGHWSASGSTVVLNSRPRPPRDFRLVGSRNEPGDGVTIRLVDENRQLLPYLECTLKNNTGAQRGRSDGEGMVQFPKQPVGSISLLFRLCPDRHSEFAALDSTHNFFEFRLEPWVAEVFFENTSLTVASDELVGPHPLLEGMRFHFAKER